MRRLRDENDLLFLVDKVIEYLKEYKDDEKLAWVAIIKAEHVYYKSDTIYATIKKRLPADNKTVYFVNEKESSMLVIKGLIQLISKNASSRINIKATLFQIYHLALHNNYFEAKTILLKSNLAEVISSYDYFI